MSANQNIGIETRRVAAEVLSRVLDKKQALEIELAANAGHSALEGSDRAFAHLLIKTTLSRLGQIDALLSQWMDTPLAPTLGMVKHVLRVGVAQLVFLEIAPHAAVHSTVEVAKALGFLKHTGLVNAILNRCVREGEALVAAQDAGRLNMPPWLWQTLVAAYGEDGARAQGLRHLRPASLDISVKQDAAKWAETLGGQLLPSGTVRLTDAGNITALPGFAEGAWWVQDAAAAMPAISLREAAGDLSGKHVLDLCAAPGGKTAQLLSMGARVTAVDQSATRMNTLKANLARLAMQAECIVADAVRYVPKTLPDAILLDAPCSATGTLRRHPDVAWHRTPEDISRLARAQERLLHHAITLLPPAAPMVYAVCSLLPEEGEAHIEALSARNDVSVERTLRLPAPCEMLGNVEDMDGFYLAVLRKKG